MKQRLKLFLCIGVALAFGGFGCKGLSKTEQQAVAPVSLEYWTVYDDVDALQKLVGKYRLLHPYLQVNIRQLRPDELYQRLIEALADDQPPDIISVNTRQLGQFQSKLASMPASVPDTTVVVTQSTLGVNTTVNTQSINLPTAAQVDRDFVQAVSRNAVVGDKVYGLPLSLDTMAIYYNKDLLDRSGVAEPPKTWDDFSAAVKKITKYNKASDTIVQAGAALGTGGNVPNNDDILYILLKQSSVDMTDKGGRAVFNYAARRSQEETPPMTVVNFYTDFANSERDTYSWNENLPNALDAFVAGKVGFFFGFSYYNAIIRARAPQLNYRIMPLLQLNPEQPVNAANFSIQTVTAKSKHPAAAWALVNYLTDSAATRDYLEATKRPTALRVFIAKQKEDADLGPFVSQVLVADSWYHGSNYPAAVKAIGDMFHEWLLPAPRADQINAWHQDVLDRAAAKINQTL